MTDCIVLSVRKEGMDQVMLHPPAFCGGTAGGDQQWAMCTDVAPVASADACTLLPFH
jgi:hypothetical protein